MNNIARKIAPHGLALLLMCASANALAAKLLTNTQLSHVTAGSAAAAVAHSANSIVIPLVFNQPLNQGGYVTGAGTLKVEPTTGSTGVTQLTLSGSAQKNLQALVNVNAANSVVQVLLNLTININSSVGQLSQLNVQAPPGH